MSESENEKESIPVDTSNEFVLGLGRNLPNHSESMNGRGNFVKVQSYKPVVFRTKQEVYRFCSWALAMSFSLPDEPGEHGFETVQSAIETL